MSSLKTMIEASYALDKRDVGLLVDALEPYPKQTRILSELFTENTDEFMKTVRSILWQIHNAKKRKTNWKGHFVLHRKGRIRVYG